MLKQDVDDRERGLDLRNCFKNSFKESEHQDDSEIGLAELL